MPFFGSRQSESEETLPATKRISAPNSSRLTTITEGGANAPVITDSLEPPPPIPRRSSRRNSAGASHSFFNSKRWSSSTENSAKNRSAPPPYDWVPESLDEDREHVGTAEDEEKLARLRSGEDRRDNKRRGGWLRLGLIIGAVLLIIIALAVGLGVGLSQRGSNNKENNTPSSAPSSSNNSPKQDFPLGQYSMVTALKDIQYGCTSNQATWRCFPYTIYSPSTIESSLASINMIITGDSNSYVTPSDPPTSEDGIPAKLSASANNPFGISFKNKPMTYIAPASNSSAARYTFSFGMPKTVVPSSAITPDNNNAQCFFNETIFTANLYLSAERTFPSPDQQNDKSIGGYQQWPYAVEITESAAGGENVPDCYAVNDGQLGEKITMGLDPTPVSDECVCDYRNFAL